MNNFKMKSKKQIRGEGRPIKEYREGNAAAWLVVKVAKGEEKMLQSRLEAEGFQHYRPMEVYERILPNKGGVELAARPLIPGYIFVQSQPTKSYKLFSLPGARGMLKIVLSDILIRKMKAREEGSFIRKVKGDKPAKRPSRNIDDIAAAAVDKLIDESVDTNRLKHLSGLFNGSARLVQSLDTVIRH